MPDVGRCRTIQPSAQTRVWSMWWRVGAYLAVSSALSRRHVDGSQVDCRFSVAIDQSGAALASTAMAPMTRSDELEIALGRLVDFR
jgi:hypothetical protein